MDTLAYGALIIIACAANAVSQMLLKHSATSTLDDLRLVDKLLGLVASIAFWSALLAFLVSLSIYAYLLSYYDAVVVFPSMALTHLFVFLLSTLVLREKASAWRFAGMSAIAIGFVLMVAGDISAMTFAQSAGPHLSH